MNGADKRGWINDCRRYVGRYDDRLFDMGRFSACIIRRMASQNSSGIQRECNAMTTTELVETSDYAERYELEEIYETTDLADVIQVCDGEFRKSPTDANVWIFWRDPGRFE